ncbi:MAG: SMI1/KNR4 family protein [Verrucomicrobiia bacterium]|jgi:hypothetical protein
MTKNITRLLSAASDPLSAAPVGELSQPTTLSGSRGQELLNLLAHRNGFYAFEAALLVRPLDYDASPLGIFQWNNEALWMSEYKTNLGGVVFFAEDIFGMQFCIKNDAVNSFDPETGEFKVIAPSLEDWSRWIWEDTKTRTGWPVAHFWQLKQGVLKPGMRLLPKVPFVLGGQFAIENLYELNDVEGMRFRASIANQLRDCPDGSKVVLNIKRSN